MWHSSISRMNPFRVLHTRVSPNGEPYFNHWPFVAQSIHHRWYCQLFISCCVLKGCSCWCCAECGGEEEIYQWESNKLISRQFPICSQLCLCDGGRPSHCAFPWRGMRLSKWCGNNTHVWLMTVVHISIPDNGPSIAPAIL